MAVAAVVATVHAAALVAGRRAEGEANVGPPGGACKDGLLREVAVRAVGHQLLALSGRLALSAGVADVAAERQGAPEEACHAWHDTGRRQ